MAETNRAVFLKSFIQLINQTKIKMKVAKFHIQNFKGLKGEHTFEPNGSSFYVIGANGVGKSSVANILIEILTNDLPKNPVTTGEKSGFVEITLTDGKKIFYKFSDDGKTKLDLIIDDLSIAKPSDAFKQLAGTGMTFDINEFLSLAPKPKRAMLEKLVGLDFTEINKREADAELHRTDIKRIHKDELSKVEPFDETLVTKGKIDFVDVSNKLQDALSARAKHDSFTEQIANRQQQSDIIKKQITDLEKRLIDINLEAIELTEQRAMLFIAPDETIKEMREQIANADEHNKSIDAAINSKKQYERVKQLESEVADAEQNVKTIRAEKDAMISKNPLPATGMTFGDDGETILLDGLPFENNQISTSRKMIAALEIAQHMLGKIKFLSFDASILDKENAERVLEYAESKGLQLAIERAIWDGGELKFEIIESDSSENELPGFMGEHKQGN